MSTGIVLLAAGESARMGEPKQALTFRGKTLLEHAVATALALDDTPVAVVLGSWSAPLAAHPRLLVVQNAEWRDGMGTSLRAGLRALLGWLGSPEPGKARGRDTCAWFPRPKPPHRVLFMVCDQPLVTPAFLGALISTHEQTGSPIVASEYGGTLGVPALFARSLFPELLALEGSEGARQIIRAHRREAIGIPFPGGAMDIDTPSDYARLRDYFTPAPV